MWMRQRQRREKGKEGKDEGWEKDKRRREIQSEMLQSTLSPVAFASVSQATEWRQRMFGEIVFPRCCHFNSVVDIHYITATLFMYMTFTLMS
jgi:hypothetical protein